MNTLAKQLSQERSLQSFLIKVLDYLHKYFKTINLQSEQKTYHNINKICSKLQSQFLNQCSIQSLAKKLILNIETKIKDKEDEEQENHNTKNKNKIIHGMKSFITNIQSTIIQDEPNSPGIPPLQIPTRSPSQDSEFTWIRKAVLEELQLLQDDIKDADDRIDDSIQQVLGKNLLGKEQFILCFESFLNNKQILETINKLGWTPLLVKNQKSKRTTVVKDVPQSTNKKQKPQEKLIVQEISITQISAYLYKARAAIIAADSITKTGGVLSPSGSLMMSIMSRKRNIPTIVISRNYCLSDKVILSQKSLTNSINPAQFFNIKNDDYNTYITKNYDYIEAKYIDMIITERGTWQVEEIAHIQDQYWKY